MIVRRLLKVPKPVEKELGKVFLQIRSSTNNSRELRAFPVINNILLNKLEITVKTSSVSDIAEEVEIYITGIYFFSILQSERFIIYCPRNNPNKRKSLNLYAFSIPFSNAIIMNFVSFSIYDKRPLNVPVVGDC